jgi:hypothetical protein
MASRKIVSDVAQVDSEGAQNSSRARNYDAANSEFLCDLGNVQSCR